MILQNENYVTSFESSYLIEGATQRLPCLPSQFMTMLKVKTLFLRIQSIELKCFKNFGVKFNYIFL